MKTRVLAVIVMGLLWTADATAYMAYENVVVKYDSRSDKRGEGFFDISDSFLYNVKNIDPKAEYIIRPRVEVDEAGFERQRLDSIAKYREKAEYFINVREILLRLKDMVGKEYVSFADSVNVEYLAGRYAGEKTVDKIRKDLKKYKISKSMRGILKKALAECDGWIEESQDELEEVQRDWIGFARSQGYPVPTKHNITYYDTVTNPLSYKYVRRSFREFPHALPPYEQLRYHAIKHSIYKENKWYDDERDDEEAYTEQWRSYPEPVNYKQFHSHPEYYVVNDVAYDSNGKMVYVLDFEIPDYALTQYFQKREIRNVLAGIAYDRNDYDVKNAGDRTNRYIRLELGLEKRSKREIEENRRKAEELANQVMGGLTDRLLAGHSTARSRGAEVNVLAELIKDEQKNYDRDGDNWLRQIEQDIISRYYTDAPPYRVDRLDPCKFVMTYCDDDYEPVLQLIYTYKQTEPFKSTRVISIGYMR